MPPPDCPFCEHQNPAGAKFCSECGSPLHLTPCSDCGAVNNLADPQCWRCGGLLLPLDSSAPVERFEDELVVPAPPTEQELEQELVALEQEVQALEPVPRFAEAPPPVVEHALRGSGTPGPKAADPRPRRVEHAFRDSNIPAPSSLFVQADYAPRGRRRKLAVGALVLALGSAIAVGAYLRERGVGSAPPAASATPPSEIRAEVATAPRPAAEIAAAPATAPARALPPGLKALDAPIEQRVANDAGEASAAAAPAAAPEPGCPPAVEAMALCEWLVRASRQ